MIESDTETSSDNIPSAYVVPIEHVIVNVAEPVQGYNDHVVYSPHHIQDLRNREALEKIIILKKAIMKAFCLALLLLALYVYFVFSY